MVGRAPWPLSPDEPLSNDVMEKSLSFLDSRSEVLALLHEAAGFERSAFARKFEEVLDARHLARLRKCGRILSLAAVIEAEEGSGDAAVERLRDCLAAGAALKDEPSIISYLVSTAILNMAAGNMERILVRGKPSAAVLLDLQREIEKCAEEFSLLPGLKGDVSWWILAHRGKIEAGHGPLDSFDMGETVSIKDRAYRWCFMKTHAVKIMHAQMWVVEEAQKRSESFYPMPEVDWEDFADKHGSAAAMSASSSYRFPVLHAQRKAFIRAAACTLAACRFRLESGEWPETLEALVPAYLSAVPDDPFADGSLRYRKENDGVKIYSVGRDRQDDGGPARKGEKSPAVFRSESTPEESDDTGFLLPLP